MKISARNQIKGTVMAVEMGQTTTHVRIDIAVANIKASDVMVGK
jgi:molybdopterin-binding protein